MSSTSTTTKSSSLSLRDPVEVYMKRANALPLLSRDEEYELAVRLFEDDDVEAARRLAESNLRLVVKIAYEYKAAYQNLLDLIQEGNVGLLHAVSKFDPHKGNRVATYAAWWIRAYMLRFILNNHRLVRIGTTQAQRKLFFGLRKERDKLEAAGFVADSKTLAKNLDVKEHEVVEMQKRLAANDASFDAPVRAGDEESGSRYDLIANDQAGPDQVVEAEQFQRILKEKLELFAASIGGREEQILRQRWLTDEPKVLRELGEQFGVSRERARQLEKRVLEQVKDYLIAELGSAVEVGLAHMAA